MQGYIITSTNIVPVHVHVLHIHIAGGTLRIKMASFEPDFGHGMPSLMRQLSDDSQRIATEARIKTGEMMSGQEMCRGDYRVRICDLLVRINLEHKRGHLSGLNSKDHLKDLIVRGQLEEVEAQLNAIKAFGGGSVWART